MASISWLPVIIGTVVAFLAGWLWYSPTLFGKGWAEGSGVELGSANEMPVFAMATQLVALFLFAILIGTLAANDMLVTAIVATFASACFVISGGAFSKKSNYAIGVDGGYIAIAGFIMIIVQSIF